ncbi:MAG TPA: DUF4123 domain-containing protein [Noviherbaspirillum sp.]
MNTQAINTTPRVLPIPPAEWCTWAKSEGLRLYAVIDESSERKPRWVRARDAREINLFADRTQDPQALAIAPRLREIAHDEPAQTRLLRLLAEQSAEQPDAFLIAATLDIDELAQRLVRRFDVNADGMEMLLRLWDARVFGNLRQGLDAKNADLVLALGVQALVPDRRGAYLPMELCEPEQDPASSVSVVLSAEETDALVELAQPDAVLAILRDLDPKLLQKVPDSERFALAFRQVEECLSRGLDTSRDQALALGLSIEHGPQWWQAPEWQQCVGQAGEAGLVAAYCKRMEALA